MLDKFKGKERLLAIIALFISLISTLIPIFRLSYPDLASSFFSTSFKYKNLDLCLWDFATGTLNHFFENINSTFGSQFDIPPALIILQSVSAIVLLGIVLSIVSLFIKNKKNRALSLGLLSTSYFVSAMMIISVFVYVKNFISNPDFMGLADMAFKFALQSGAFLLPLSLAASAFFIFKSKPAKATTPSACTEISRPLDVPTPSDTYEPPTFCTICGKKLYGGEKCNCAVNTPVPKPAWTNCPDCGKRLGIGERCNCSDRETVTAGGLKSTMKCRRCGKKLGTCDCPPSGSEPTIPKRIDNEYFGKAGDL